MTLHLISYRLAIALGATREPPADEDADCILVECDDNAPLLFWFVVETAKSVRSV